MLALVLALMLLASSLGAVAAVPTADSKGSITINSPIIGAKYYAYQIFKMTLDDDTHPTTYGYYIGKDDTFYSVVADYAKTAANGLKLTGIPSTLITAAIAADPDNGVEAQDAVYGEYTVSVDLDKFDAQTFGAALQTAMPSMDPVPTADSTIDTVGTNNLDKVTFENLAYGYYLITNDYDDPVSRGNVILKNGDTEIHTFTPADYTFTRNADGIVTDVTVKGLETPDTTTTPAQTKSYAEQFAESKYPDWNTDANKTVETQYKEDHAGDNTVKTWESMSETEKNAILGQYRESAKQNAIDLVKNKILTHASDDDAADGTIKTRLVFIDSTTPKAVINEKNEFEKWDEPVNPDGYADGPDTPNHDEPHGGKNIVVQENPVIYANSTEAAIGDKIHYQLSVNAVNFERTDANDPKSVQQIKEYIIADYENKNMKYVPKDGDKYGLTVTIVKRNADGTTSETVAGPMDYSKWVEKKNQFFINTSKTDLDANDDNIFDNNNVGGIVIPWVTKVRDKNATESDEEYLDYIATLSNVYKNSVYAKASDDQGITAEAYAAKTTAEKHTYFLGNDGKYYSKVPVYATVENPVAGRSYKVTYGGDTEYTTWVLENGKYYLTDSEGHKVQQISKDGEKVWQCDTVYFQSKYDNDVTILVDYWMELLDTAVIDGEGNPNISQFGVNYVEPYDTDYEFGTKEKPGENPPDEPKKPSEEKEQDDAVVYTYAIVIKKVDNEGNKLVGAKFKLRGVTVTQKTAGYYKVKTYSHASDAEFGTELSTDDNGVLVVEGFPTKWNVEIMETEAPVGYNKLTDTVFIKPYKTGSEVTTISTETKKNENDEITSVVTTTTVTLKDKDGNQVAQKVTVGESVKYYGANADTPSTKEAFEVAEATYASPDKTELTAPASAIATIEIVNNAGAELPATGGMGTTLFYVAGSLMVLAAAILLITKRRMGADE